MNQQEKADLQGKGLITVKVLMTVIVTFLVWHTAYIIFFVNSIIALLFVVVPSSLMAALWGLKNRWGALAAFMALLGIAIWLAPAAFSSFTCAPHGCN